MDSPDVKSLVVYIPYPACPLILEGAIQTVHSDHEDDDNDNDGDDNQDDSAACPVDDCRVRTME